MYHSHHSPGVPYWRLSGLYFLFFVTVGIFLPYWPLYLQHIGMDARQIGILSAIVVVTKIFSAFFWGWVVDHTAQRMRVIRGTALLTAVTFALVLPVEGFTLLALILFLFSFFWSAALPQIEAATLTHLGNTTHDYAGIRLWGSIGFIISVWSLGQVLDHISVARVPILILISLLIAWAASMVVPPEAPERHEAHTNGLVTTLGSREVMAFFGICFLMLASHGPYYTFYSIYLEDQGYSRSVTGGLWAIGVIAEVLVFLCMRQLLGRFSLKTLLQFSLFCAVARWLLIGFCADIMTLLLIAQMLHAATFGLYHVVALQYVHRFFQGRLQGRGQALYSSVGFGAGLAVGTFVSGYIWNSAGSGASFAAASGMAVVAVLIAWRRLKS